MTDATRTPLNLGDESRDADKSSLIDLQKAADLKLIAETYKAALAAETGWGSEALDAAQDAFDTAFDPDGVLSLLAQVSDLRGAQGFDADELGKALHEAYWRRNDEREPPPWKGTSEAIRKMWRGIAIDAARFLFNPGEPS